MTRNDETPTSLMDTSTSFAQEGQMLSPDRRRVRVDFAYSFDNDQLVPMTQTTIIKSEPCFKVTAIEDEVTKHFYHNKSHNKIDQRIPSEADSLDEDYSYNSHNEKQTTYKGNNAKHPVSDRTNSSSIKSILKKSQTRQEEKNQSRPLSPSSKGKGTSSTGLDSNSVEDLAEMTARHKVTSPSIYTRSLHSQTINIFDPNNSYEIRSKTPRPPRLQYYIKPYRGEPSGPTNKSKLRSRSLSRNRLAQSLPLSTARRNTDPNSTKSMQPSTRQSSRNVSWSPAREYIHQEKDQKMATTTTTNKKKEILSNKINSSTLSIGPSLSLNIPCIPNSSSIISIPIRFQKSQSTQFPAPCSSIDSYYSPTAIDHSMISIKPIIQNNYNYEAKENILISSYSSSTVGEYKREHNTTMQRYDKLLEKMRSTDEELKLLSRSWMYTNKQHQIPVSTNDLFYPEVSETYEIEFFNG
ncbi:unnamed protein product [Adineta steineri]|uniref:Uncharacterized protein n=1 Tax=Adineta steineri TaxID=433720 RepID=A0A819J7P8_9BILA|nr:unnamed protein product [Adineta steineri]